MSAIKGMHPELIKAQIRMKGKTLTQLAAENELSTTAVVAALRKPMTSGEKVISKFLDIAPHLIWPDRWTTDGQRIRPRYKHKYNV